MVLHLAGGCLATGDSEPGTESDPSARLASACAAVRELLEGISLCRTLKSTSSRGVPKSEFFGSQKRWLRTAVFGEAPRSGLRLNRA